MTDLKKAFGIAVAILISFLLIKFLLVWGIVIVVIAAVVFIILRIKRWLDSR